MGFKENEIDDKVGKKGTKHHADEKYLEMNFILISKKLILYPN